MINLQKGQRIEIGLSKVGVSLGWDLMRVLDLILI